MVPATPASPGVVGRRSREGARSVISTSIGTEAVALDLAAEQVERRDADLLVLGVAVEPDDLHAVDQTAGIVSADVPGGDEQAPRRGQGRPRW
jgi:hypothetical protein